MEAGGTGSNPVTRTILNLGNSVVAARRILDASRTGSLQQMFYAFGAVSGGPIPSSPTM